MNSVILHESNDRILDVLESIRKKGIRLWSENGQLHYKAPNGALTQDEIERLRVSRYQIVALLEGVTGAEPVESRLEPRRTHDRVPLAFSQLAHWYVYRLSERLAIRQVASATRLRGRLNIDALRHSAAEIVRRHDALRTRIVVCDGTPMQEIDESGGCELEVDDLTNVSKRYHEVEVKRLIEQLILEPIDVAVGPLFGARVLKLCDDEHVLILAMEHMISDGFSLNVLARDLLTAYTQAVRGRACSLPPIPMQFADYAARQRSAQNKWIKKHGAYWTERLAGCQRLKFPEDRRSSTDVHVGWGTVPVQISRELKAELRQWCRLRQTTVVMSVFAAYVGLVLRWCDVPEAVFKYQSDGRSSSKVENAIGYFATLLYLRIQLREDDSFVDLIKQTTEEYCNAYEHADYFYMMAQVPRPEFTRNTVFNWLPRGSIKPDLSYLDGSEDAIACFPVRFEHPMVRNLELEDEPFVLLCDGDDEINGDVYFPLNRFSMGTMNRFARNFLVFIRALLSQPEESVKDIRLV